MTQFVQAFIGLGSNMDDPVAQLDKAVGHLQSWSGISLLAVSGYYGSAPIGPQDQPDFVNAVADVSTNLSPQALLHALQDIEQRHHRERLVHWGPRTLDLDILLYGNQTVDQAELTVPHPRMTERAFVLVPLSDLAPDLILHGQSLDTWLEATSEQSIYTL